MSVRVLVGDVRARLAELPADSFDCVVTSPPYWGLRDYGVEGQIGLEPTLGEHLAVMVDVFREVRRVLKPTGTLWLNYGDAYANNASTSTIDRADQGNGSGAFRIPGQEHVDARRAEPNRLTKMKQDGLKHKDLMMIPNRLAIALQDDGWWVRSECIWGKPNPMPESTRDRPATAHEKIFMLTKAARYFYAPEEVRQGQGGNDDVKTTVNGWAKPGMPHDNVGHARAKREGKQAAIAAAAEAVGSSPGRRMAGFNERWDAKEKLRSSEVGPRHAGHINHTGIDDTPRGSRSLRNWEPAPPSVWVMGTSPFKDAHFATSPPELVERCLRAGCPVGGSVLDPFGGAGTTALVADQMQLDATIIELNPGYVHIAIKRIEADRGPIQNALDPLQLFGDAA